MGYTLAVIGGGNMARSIISGALEEEILNVNEIVVADPDPLSRGFFDQLGIDTVADAGQLPASEQMLLAVKPQIFAEVAQYVTANTVLSIMAGVSTDSIASKTTCNKIIRIMPNLPCSIGLGAAGMSLGATASTKDAALATKLFSAIGKVVMVDEPLMDAVTALSGSGPAYLFLLAESMIEGGMRVGLDFETANALVRQTLLGASSLLSEDDRTASKLREAVTSKGGTTSAALSLMLDRGVVDAIADGVVAARDRAQELG